VVLQLAACSGFADASCGRGGSLFDGRYVSLVPSTSDIALRFDARTSPALRERGRVVVLATSGEP
jgi:hypothetical protein